MCEGTQICGVICNLRSHPEPVHRRAGTGVGAKEYKELQIGILLILCKATSIMHTGGLGTRIGAKEDAGAAARHAVESPGHLLWAPQGDSAEDHIHRFGTADALHEAFCPSLTAATNHCRGLLVMDVICGVAFEIK